MARVPVAPPAGLTYLRYLQIVPVYPFGRLVWTTERSRTYNRTGR